MQEGQNARQQIVERIRQSTSILVALSNNPTVDALSASFALSLMLTKMNKHSTAVFSGTIPPAIQFLEPNKTFETNVDALRDFIISLDKEKADRLRYKVEDDVVRIFITPYKTSISEKDLEFSQGDFNVDLIVALGVEKRDDLDKAIVAHGRILHDATIITINPNTQHSSLGSIDWNDGSSSSLCEMLVTLSEAFQQPGLLDAQISTALLTGIVAATERFSNTHTSPRVMTMAAQLMAAGANQQLIATNLAKAQEAPVAAPQSAGTLAKQPASTQPTPMQEEPPKKKEPGELDITHEKKQEQPPKVEEKPAPAPEPHKESSAEEELATALPSTAAPSHNFIELKDELENASKKEEDEGPEHQHKAPGSASVNGDEEEVAKQPEHEEEYLSSHSSWKGKRLEPPTLGGTLNATTEEAMEDSKKALDEERNKMLLTHPEDKQNPGQGQGQSKRKNKKDRQNQNQNQNQGQNQPQPAPVAPAPAPAPEPVPEPTPPAPAPEPTPEPAPMPAPVAEPTPAAPPDLPPLPPMPTLEPTPAPVPTPLPEPALEPMPAAEPPAPAPAPAPEPEANLDSLAASAAEAAAAAAQPAATAAGEIDNARQAVSNALDAAPFNPSNQPTQSVGAQEVPPMPNMPVSEPLSQDALQALPPAPVAPTPTAPAPTPAPTVTDLPPLPPMPPMPPTSDALPPAPDLPGLNQPLPPMAPDASTQPQNPPTPPAPSDPAQFKIPGA